MHVTTGDFFANARVVEIRDNTLVIEPDCREMVAGETWFWWAVRVHPGNRDRFRIQFPRPHCLTRMGPCVSLDNGRTWQFARSEPVALSEKYSEQEMDVPNGEDSLLLALCPPYQLSDWEAFTSSVKGTRPLFPETLTLSRSGRPVPCLRIGDWSRAPKRAIITARHHACEAPASFVMEGLIQGCTEALPEGIAVTFIPFVDSDGVANAEQGKLRAPHDHNRDYETGLYPEVKAVKDLVRECGDRLAVFLDLHAPWVRNFRDDEWNEHVYQVGQGDETRMKAQERFARILARRHAGVLPVSNLERAILPVGRDWNTGSGTHSSASWVAANSNAGFISTFEFPYALVEEVATGTNAYRELGRSMAYALREFWMDAG